MATISGGRVRGGHTLATTWRVPRTRGATSGLLVLLLGAWGALVPFIGPQFGYGFTPDATWTMTAGRLWLEVVPGAVAVLAGLMLIGSKHRAMGVWAGWLGAVAGAWFAVGPLVVRLWNNGPQMGTPVASSTLQAVLEQIGMFTGLGVVMVFLTATAIGRFSVVGVRDGEVVEETPIGGEVPATEDPAMDSGRTSRMRFGRRRDRVQETDADANAAAPTTTFRTDNETND